MFTLIIAGITTYVTVEPESIVEAKQITALIQKLDADDFRARDRAGKEIRAIGVPALEFLKQASASGANAEIREHSCKLTRDIRRETCVGGDVVDGLQAKLRSDRDVFRANEPITLDLEIINVDRPNLAMPPGLKWSYAHTYGPARYQVRTLWVPSNAHIELHQVSGTKIPKNLSPFACGPFGKVNNQAVKIGDSAVYSVPVSMCGDLLPGDYEARIVFFTYLVMEQPKGQLISNMVRFTVE